MNEFNRRTAMNYHLRTGLDEQLDRDAAETAIQHILARRRIAHRRRTAAIRQHNKLVALDLTLSGVLGMALGVLVCFIF